jgi:rhodanese-related sulfurtransferase
MEKRAFKDKVYTILAGMVKAMANPHRLEIIDLLGQGERSVDEIAAEAGMSVANASQHLQTLKQSNLVAVRREGNFIHYRLASDNVYKSWRDLRAIGMESLAEVDKLVKDFRAKRNSLEPVNLQQLLEKKHSRNIVLLDVRPEHEFNAGHIPDAINIPIDKLASRIKDLNKSKQYIAYCRGPFCVFADDAVELLTKKGFKARRLEEGYPDWKLQTESKLVS